MAKFRDDLTVAGCSNFPVPSFRYRWTRTPVNQPSHYLLLLGYDFMLLARQSFYMVSVHVLFLYSQDIFLDLLRNN